MYNSDSDTDEEIEIINVNYDENFIHMLDKVISMKLDDFSQKIDTKIIYFFNNLDKHIADNKDSIFEKTNEYIKLIEEHNKLNTKIQDLQNKNKNKLYEEKQAYLTKIEKMKKFYVDQENEQLKRYTEIEEQYIKKIEEKETYYQNLKNKLICDNNDLKINNNDLKIENRELLNYNNDLKIKKKLLDTTEDENMCIICYEREKRIILIPCGHYYYCEECSNLIDECSVCKCKIEKRYKVY